MTLMTVLALAAAAQAQHAHGHGQHAGHDMGKAHAMQCAAIPANAADTLFNQFNAAWATKNPDTVTALFAPDAVLLATVSNKPRTSPAEVRDYFVSFLKNSRSARSTAARSSWVATARPGWASGRCSDQPRDRGEERRQGALQLHLQISGRQVVDRPFAQLDDAGSGQVGTTGRRGGR